MACHRRRNRKGSGEGALCFGDPLADLHAGRVGSACALSDQRSRKSLTAMLGLVDRIEIQVAAAVAFNVNQWALTLDDKKVARR
jgi:hypothetical protein